MTKHNLDFQQLKSESNFRQGESVSVKIWKTKIAIKSLAQINYISQSISCQSVSLYDFYLFLSF